MHTLIAHLNDAPRPPQDVRPGVPADLSAVLLRCLAKNPPDRFQDAAGGAAALRARPAAGPTSTQRSGGARGRRRVTTRWRWSGPSAPMKPWTVIGRTSTPDGTELTLTHHATEYVIAANGQSLMSSRMHGSEDALARL